MRRSQMEPRSAAAMARKSSTYATGAPWKLPLDSTRPSPSSDGVVDGGGELPLGDAERVREGVASGAGDLGGAAHGVGVLNARGVACDLGVPPGEAGAGEDAEHVVGGRALARVGPDGVQLGRQDLVGPEQRFEAERGGDVGGGVEPLQVVYRHEQHAEHAVGAVEEGQALLLAQLDGHDAVRGEQLPGGPDDPVGAFGVTLAHQREGAVAEGGEVAGAAERTVLVDDGGDTGVEEVRHGPGDVRPYAGVAGGDGLEPQEHQRAYDFALDVRAHAGGVRPDDVALQLGAQVLTDVPGREGAEPGRDAVDGLGLGGERVDDLARGGEGGEGLLGELDPGVVPGDGDDIRCGRSGRPQHDCLHIHIQNPTD